MHREERHCLGALQSAENEGLDPVSQRFVPGVKPSAFFYFPILLNDRVPMVIDISTPPHIPLQLGHESDLFFRRDDVGQDLHGGRVKTRKVDVGEVEKGGRGLGGCDSRGGVAGVTN
eukprot:evm.model.NODE_12390_length_20121_cov_16.951593.6